MVDRSAADANGAGGPPPPEQPAGSPALAGDPTRHDPLRPLAVVQSQEPEGFLEEVEGDWLDAWANLPSWLASLVVHLVLVLLMALGATVVSKPDLLESIEVSSGSGGEDDRDLEPALLDSDTLETATALDATELEKPDAQLIEPPVLSDVGTLPVMPPLESPASAGLPREVGLPDGIEGGVGSLRLRSRGDMRQYLLQSEGGTPESEAAVQRALAWLAEHQEYNGSWSFDHAQHPKCNGQCDNKGYTNSPIAATGLALLPFLGNGHTQHEGKYKDNVNAGLKFLMRSVKRERRMGSLWDPHGMMYGHGLASIALCEAYGMSHDGQLRRQAQSVINFIVDAQDPAGGGWRYHPRMPGDTSVVGWQLMALKSAEMADLAVPDATLKKVSKFLDSVQSNRGANYGYQIPETTRPPNTAIGLLCRMYLGWKRDHEALRDGVHQLSILGPSTENSGMPNNMYYNYYATQVLHHFGGPDWPKWNEVMREYLIDTQARTGHETGSWYFDGVDQGSGAGGRLYCTAMATMILEVYYRHMPLYREQSVN